MHRPHGILQRNLADRSVVQPGDMQILPGQDAAEKLKPFGRIVIAGNCQHRHPALCAPSKKASRASTASGRRNGTVVQVARQQDHVRFFLHSRLQHPSRKSR